MSINLTQEFVFETDDLDSLEQMLDTILRILFQKGRYQKTAHVMRMQITGDTIPQTPTCFRDGRYEDWNWGTARPMMIPVKAVAPDVVCNDESFALVAHGQTYGGTSQLKVLEHHDDRDIAARAASAQEIKPKPTRRWITSIWDSDHENTHLKANEVFKARGYADLVREAVKLCKQANQKAFLNDFRDVEPDTDGSVAVRFRLESRPRALDISLAHIVYGK